MPDEALVRPWRYVCYGCRQISTFRLRGKPRQSWVLTCRKCHKYHRHALLKRRLFTGGADG